ncbi:MAG: hypothetical protein ABSB75_04775 [Candidatus Limnocylindrales bacterium]
MRTQAERLAAALRRHRRGLLALGIAVCSGLFITRGVAMVFEPAGWIVAGLLLAGLLFVDLGPDRRANR